MQLFSLNNNWECYMLVFQPHFTLVARVVHSECILFICNTNIARVFMEHFATIFAVNYDVFHSHHQSPLVLRHSHYVVVIEDMKMRLSSHVFDQQGHCCSSL